MAEQVRDVVERYVKLVGSGPTEEIVNLYAADATVEDPIGTPIKHGHAEIREFYEVLGKLDRETELKVETVRIAGNHAAFMFTIVTKFGDQSFTLMPIDVMEFNDEGKIINMRAYWSPEDMSSQAV
ncbi:nuclear transport factor 2 family protein [Nocardia australiensis]|uniref:nuclear transport factor 2 family protein n=1 Tax=Nocardia australiensis TaxID=2887191 RepID=UPI001D1496B9|nr:nuclear transport factor 2 family protein [Nocardia australiensis]